MIVMFLFLTYSQYVRTTIFILVLIVIGSLSKIYHKFLKSKLGLDFILFPTLIVSLTYNNIILGFVVGIPSILIADYLANKLSHYTLVTLIGLCSVIILSKFFLTFPLVIALILLTLIFEIITVVFYYLMGSSLPQIILFFTSHLVFNLVLIFSFTNLLTKIII